MDTSPLCRNCFISVDEHTVSSLINCINDGLIEDTPVEAMEMLMVGLITEDEYKEIINKSN